MKNMFLGYYELTSEESAVIWNDSIIVTDANVLLNLYTYSTSTWEELLRLMTELKDRLWLPFQVADEYHRNRVSSIRKEARRYSEIHNSLKIVADELGARKRHPFIDPELFKDFQELSARMDAALKTGEKAHSAFVRKDPIREQLTDIFEGRVGESLRSDVLDKIYRDGAVRYAKKIPPGYQDEKKPEPERYGDLVVWREMIEKAKCLKKGMVFVTDDAKNDWWLIIDGETIGPRPELLREFQSETGQTLCICKSDEFIARATERGKALSEKALAELEAARKSREEEDLRKAANCETDNSKERALYSIPTVELASAERAMASMMKIPMLEVQASAERAMASMMKNQNGANSDEQRESADSGANVNDCRIDDASPNDDPSADVP